MEEEQLGGKTLGVPYWIKQDKIHYTLKPCYYSGKQSSSDSVRQVTVLDQQDVAALRAGTRSFTRRQALSLVMGVYDPLGLVSPAVLHGKLLLRKLYASADIKSWDQDLPLLEKRSWANWFAELLEPAEAVFPRSTRPVGAVGVPRLAGFCDASLVAVCAALYVVWQKEDGSYTSRLLMGKCRVAPLLGTTVPRGELQSIVILHRHLLFAVDAFPMRFKSISVFTDSMCSIRALNNQDRQLKPFFANRVSEVLHIRAKLQEMTDELPPIQHVAGSINPTDGGTRGQARIRDLGPASDWQRGPDFLQRPYKEWPVLEEGRRKSAEIPEGEMK